MAIAEKKLNGQPKLNLPHFTIFAASLLLIVLGIAASLRLVSHPERYEIRDGDELPYQYSGVQQFEGIPGGMKTTPNGPQTWLSFTFMTVKTAINFITSRSTEPNQPSPIRFYTAADKSLFEVYEDASSLRQLILSWQLLIALLGTAAAFLTGWRLAGEWCGVTVGGLVACLPLFVEFSGMTRPYSDSWSAILISIFFIATAKGNIRHWGGGVAFGFAIAGRLDMLALAPVMVLASLLNPTPTRIWSNIVKLTAISAITAYCISPWTVTHFFGMLRSVATIRIAGQFHSDSPRVQTATELFWEQGLGPTFVALAITILGQLRRPIWKSLALFGYFCLLVVSMFTGPYQPIRYHGGVILAATVLLALFWNSSLVSLGKWQFVVAAFILSIPVYQSVKLVQLHQQSYVHDEAIEWIETNIESGTPVYLVSAFEPRALLPTDSAADRLWNEVTDSQAWRKKFQRGLDRFQLDVDKYPRAFSEENLWLNRGNRRRFFILGGGDSNRPRYDLYIVGDSPTFDVANIRESMEQTGGIYVYRGLPPDAAVWKTLKSWQTASGSGKFIVALR